jgi:hypothetical protein
MNAALRAKFEAARRSQLPVGDDRKLTIRRPSPWDVASAHANSVRMDLEWASQFVVDWNFKEVDLIPGGLPEPVVFDAEVFNTWIKDHPSFWTTVVQGVMDAHTAYEKAQEERGNV